MYTLGAIGAGHMGMTILEGTVKTGTVKPTDIIIYDLSPERVSSAHAQGYVTAEDEFAVYENCKYLLVAVLPQNIEALLQRLSTQPRRNKPVVISIVSGAGSAFIRHHLGNNIPVVNVVPNLALSAGMGATAIARTDDLPENAFNAIVRVFEKLGQVVVMEERFLKEIIPINGCSPGYAFYIIEAMARAAVEKGVDYSLAVKMAAAGFAGASQMLLDAGESPSKLLAKVCSPGGLTEKGINYFNEKGLADIIAEGVAASAGRGYELALDV